MARAGLPRLAQLLRRPRVRPLHALVSPQAATPAAAVAAVPFCLDTVGAYDHHSVATRRHPPPLAGAAFCRQSPEAGAGWFNDHVRICAGGVRSNAHSYHKGCSPPTLQGHYRKTEKNVTRTAERRFPTPCRTPAAPPVRQRAPERRGAAEFPNVRTPAHPAAKCAAHRAGSRIA